MRHPRHDAPSVVLGRVRISSLPVLVVAGSLERSPLPWHAVCLRQGIEALDGTAVPRVMSPNPTCWAYDLGKLLRRQRKLPVLPGLFVGEQPTLNISIRRKGTTALDDLVQPHDVAPVCLYVLLDVANLVIV